MKLKLTILLCFYLMLSQAQPGKILSHQRISYNQGNFTVSPDTLESFGNACCALGDLDKDGKPEILVTTNQPDVDELCYILSMNQNGTVFRTCKIGRDHGLPNNATPTWLTFGSSCANIGDLNKDGITDVAIGNPGESGYGGDLFIVFLNADGSIKSHKLIAQGQNGFNGSLGSNDKFGCSVTKLGDIDDDGTIELVVGARSTGDGTTEGGAIWILSLDSTGTCTDFEKISNASGGGSALGLTNTNRFGSSCAAYRDIDNDSIPEFFVGAPFWRLNNIQNGKIYGVSINSDKTLKSFKIITDTSQNFGDTLNNPTLLGAAIGNLGDIDSNGFEDIAVGTYRNGPGFSRGHIRVLLMDNNFSIDTAVAWDSLTNGAPAIGSNDGLGQCVCGIGDLNLDGRLDAFAGMPGDEKDHMLYGAGYVFFLDGKAYTYPPPPPPTGIMELPAEILSIYPVPAENTTSIQIHFPEILSGHNKILVIKNMLGKTVFNSGIINDLTFYRLPEISLPTGIYLVQITGNENKFNGKIILK
jgi:hypothetical protein